MEMGSSISVPRIVPPIVAYEPTLGIDQDGPSGGLRTAIDLGRGLWAVDEHRFARSPRLK
jgi:hypothetical protein